MNGNTTYACFQGIHFDEEPLDKNARDCTVDNHRYNPPGLGICRLCHSDDDCRVVKTNRENGNRSIAMTKEGQEGEKRLKVLLRSTLPMNLSAAHCPANPAGTAVFAIEQRSLAMSVSIVCFGR